VYVLPSFNEGMPVSILEAMSHGLPVISTTVGGIPELVRDGVDGRLIAPGNVSELARCIGELAASPALRQQMGSAGRERVLTGFSEEAVVPRIRSIYTRLSLK
jgi:glycosyltransferase involved in cell wall biosynthesis